MSLRSAVRIAARPRAAPAARAVVPRRFASSSSDPSSHQPKGGASNATWAMGSAAVFGGLAAFIMMPSGKKEHVAHQHHPHEPKEPEDPQHTKQELRDNVKNAPVESAAKKSQGNIDYEEIDAAKKEGRETTNPPKAVVQGDKKAPGEDENKGGNDDGSSATSSDESAGGYEPSQKEVADSIKQAEKSNAPLVAEEAEEKE